MKESLERINVISNIGHLTQHLKRIVENPDDEVHIGGDYKAIAPQSLIKKYYWCDKIALVLNVTK